MIYLYLMLFTDLTTPVAVLNTTLHCTALHCTIWTNASEQDRPNSKVARAAPSVNSALLGHRWLAQCSAVQCSAMQFGTLCYIVIDLSTFLCVRPFNQYNRYIYTSTLHCTALHCTALHCTDSIVEIHMANTDCAL